MTFLAKLGSFLAKGIALLTGLGPLILPLFGSKAQAASGIAGTVVNDLTAIGQVVVSAEAILGPGTGPAKLAAAAPLVATLSRPLNWFQATRSPTRRYSFRAARTLPMP